MGVSINIEFTPSKVKENGKIQQDEKDRQKYA
jgi:hypothetical protein